MEITFFFLIVFLAFIGELMDSSLGMGYGTLLAPILILMSFSPIIVVPAILLTQALGGFLASLFHQKFKNVDFYNGKDRKISITIAIFGILAVVFAILLATTIPEIYIKTYISILVLMMGFLILFKEKPFKFKWSKIVFIGFLSSFNKAISGGGFGPIVTSGQIISGQKYKNAIGVTTLSEVPICLLSFIIYLIFTGYSCVSLSLIIPLTIGVIISTPLGALITKKININKLKITLAILLIIVAIWGLLKIFLF